MRERLVELIMNSRTPLISRPIARTIADDLIENGVIVPPCKVGDTLYDAREYIYGAPCPELYEMKSNEITVEKLENGDYLFSYDGVYIRHDEINKTVFLTKEEAEKALKGGAE